MLRDGNWFQVKVKMTSKVVFFCRSAALILGIAGSAAIAAQTVSDDQVPSSAANLDLPENLQIFGKVDPNVRKPTAIVNGYVITRTDVDQRFNLFVALNQLKLSPEEQDRLRLQVLRLLTDETIQIQEAKANEVTIPADQIDRSFASISSRYQRTPDQMRAWLREIGSSERSFKRQIEGELAWQRVIQRKIGAFINTIIDFVIVAFGIFLVVKGFNYLRKKEAEKPAEPPAPTEDQKLLTEIRDILKTK